MTLSQGAKKELLIIYFAKALIETSKLDYVDGVLRRDRSNKLHNDNKKIDRRIDSLFSLLQNTADKLTNSDIAGYLHSKAKNKLLLLTKKLCKDDIQLEMLALYVMLINFCERKNPLDSNFDKYTNANMYFDDMDLIKKTNITEDDEQKMMMIAYDAIAFLKG